MSLMPDSAGSADGSGAYYCGWAITGRTTVLHLVVSANFPIAGTRHRTWCGQIITVIGLTLNARDLPGSYAECNQQLRMMAMTQRLGEHDGTVTRVAATQ